MATIPLGLYIFKRLHSLGIRNVFGVPGDYNLSLLDYIYEVKGLNWVGNCNELNAGYAADGYARVKGMSALVTTFGVGELSAINAVAGAYSEQVPLVHIVGCPSTSLQSRQAVLHHTLGNGDFHVFRDMAKPISDTQCYLDDPATAPAQIDRAIADCRLHARPVYILLPSDMVPKQILEDSLHKQITLSLPANDAETEAEVLSAILDLLYGAKNPVILADACATRHDVVKELHQLVDKLQIPAFVSPMGKGAINETNPHYGGVYVGELSHQDVRSTVESSDLVLSIGALLSDFNTGAFSYHIGKSKTIEFHTSLTQVRYAIYPGIGMKYLLRKLIDNVDPSRVSRPVKAKDIIQKTKEIPASKGDLSSVITHDWFWPTMGSSFFRPKDIIVAETGTSGFGILEATFPEDVIGISQVLWGSIGYATGATLGAALGARDLEDGSDRRTILFTGEGSLQLTVQEISTMIRTGVTPVLFIIVNNGYTIEKLIHGRDKAYNNVAIWKYDKLLETFGASNPKNYRVQTKHELLKLITNQEFAAAKAIQVVEVIMDEFDAPRGLKTQASRTESLNKQ